MAREVRTLSLVTSVPSTSARTAEIGVYSLIGPHPVPDLGLVLVVRERVRRRLGPAGLAFRHEGGRAVAEARRLADRLGSEMEAAHLVQHDHLERRGRRPLLVEPADMDAVDVRLPVHRFRGGALVPMECE